MHRVGAELVAARRPRQHRDERDARARGGFRVDRVIADVERAIGADVESRERGEQRVRRRLGARDVLVADHHVEELDHTVALEHALDVGALLGRADRGREAGCRGMHATTRVAPSRKRVFGTITSAARSRNASKKARATAGSSTPCRMRSASSSVRPIVRRTRSASTFGSPSRSKPYAKHSSTPGRRVGEREVEVEEDGPHRAELDGGAHRPTSHGSRRRSLAPFLLSVAIASDFAPPREASSCSGSHAPPAHGRGVLRSHSSRRSSRRLVPPRSRPPSRKAA